MKTVLITGACGGMGDAAVKRFKELGYLVLALDIKEYCGCDGVIPIVCDVTDEACVKVAFLEAKKYTEKLDAIVHFAGIYMLDSFVEMESREFDRIFDINLRGAFLINKTFLPLMKRGGRVIITTSELAPLDPLPFTGVYAVTKAALDKYAFSLAMELQLLGIKVSVIRAGAVDTGMLGASTDALDTFCKDTELYSCNAKRFKDIVEGVEARRIPAKKIADKCVKVLNKKHPRFAYSINRNPLLLILSVLPKRLQLFVIALVLKNK